MFGDLVALAYNVAEEVKREGNPITNIEVENKIIKIYDIIQKIHQARADRFIVTQEALDILASKVQVIIYELKSLRYYY